MTVILFDFLIKLRWRLVEIPISISYHNYRQLGSMYIVPSSNSTSAKHSDKQDPETKKPNSTTIVLEELMIWLRLLPGLA
jgi:hypothetical protein